MKGRGREEKEDCSAVGRRHIQMVSTNRNISCSFISLSVTLLTIPLVVMLLLWPFFSPLFHQSIEETELDRVNMMKTSFQTFAKLVAIDYTDVIDATWTKIFYERRKVGLGTTVVRRKKFSRQRLRSFMPWKDPGEVRARTYGTKSPSLSEALCFIDSAKSPSTKTDGSLVNYRRRLTNRSSIDIT